MNTFEMESAGSIGVQDFYPAFFVQSQRIVVMGEGRPLLTLHPDGKVEASIDDTEEAALHFLDCVRRLWLAQVSPASEHVNTYTRSLVHSEVAALLEKGRQRIVDLGGECDPVDRMAADVMHRLDRSASEHVHTFTSGHNEP